MTKVEPFNNPPITEAIFDIRVDLSKEVNLETLSSFGDSVKDRFPDKKNRRKIGGGFQFREGSQPRVIAPTDEVYGYQFHSLDKKQVVQARLDGFSFNQLKPYSNWDEFSQNAFKLSMGFD